MSGGDGRSEADRVTCANFTQHEVQYGVGIVCAAVFAALLARIACAQRAARRGDVAAGRVVLLPSYMVVLWAIAGVLGARTLLFLVVEKRSTAFDGLEWIGINPVVSALRDGTAVLLAGTAYGRRAQTRAGFFAVCWLISHALLGWSYWLDDDEKFADDVQYSDYWLLHDWSVAVLHVSVIGIALRRLARGTSGRRPAVPLLAYSTFMALCFGPGYGLLMVHALPGTLLGCWWAGADFLYFSCWPIVAYFTLKADTAYWRDIGKGLAGLPQHHKRASGDLLTVAESVRLSAPTIDFAAFTWLEVLGSGASAYVMRALVNLPGETTQREVAVKKYAASSVERADIIAFVREVSLLSSLQHPNILRLHGAFVEPPWLGVVVDLCPHGSLFDFQSKMRESAARASGGRKQRSKQRRGPASRHTEALLDGCAEEDGSADDAVREAAFEESAARGELTATQKAELARDVFAGIAYLHERGVLHGDIKSLNVLLLRGYRACLADFGESRGASEGAAVRRAREATLSAVRSASSHATGRTVSTAERPGMMSPLEYASGPTDHSSSTSASPSRGVALTPRYVESAEHRSSTVSSILSGDGDGSNVSFRCTPQWAAPEVLRGEKYAAAADVYAGGMVVYELLAGCPPFSNVPAAHVSSVVLAGARPQLPRCEGATLTALRAVVEQCWSHEASARPSATEALDSIRAACAQG